MTTDPIQPPVKTKTALPPISVRATVATALKLLKAEWWQLLRIAAVPILFIWLPTLLFKVPTNVAAQISHSPMTPAEQKLYLDALVSQSPHFIISYIITVLMMAWVRVAGLRYLVLGEKSDVWLPNYQPRMWRYLWRSFWVMLMIILVLLVTAPLCLILIGIVIAPLAFTIVATRIGISVPATAIQDDSSMKSAWQRTRGQVMRITTTEFLWGSIFFMIMLIPLAIAFLISGYSIAEVAQFPITIAKIPHPAQEFLWAAWGIIHYITYVIGTIVSLPINALLYAHFYQDKQSPVEGDGGPVVI